MKRLVVPVPKNDLAGIWTANFFQPHVPITAPPHVTAEQAKSLEAAGLYSIGEFLQIGTRARAQARTSMRCSEPNASVWRSGRSRPP